MSRFINYVINFSYNDVPDILFICHIFKELHYIYLYTFCIRPQLVSNHYMFRCECHVIFQISILKLTPRGGGVEYRWYSIITERVQYSPIKRIAIKI